MNKGQIIGKRAYELRLSGLAWKDIAGKLEYTGNNSVAQMNAFAKTYAATNGKKWPLDKPKITHFKIQIFLLVNATPYSVLGENDIYVWVDLPRVKGQKYFDSYLEASEFIEDIQRGQPTCNDYKVVES